MAKLSTYEKDNSISGEDLLAGSNYVSLNTYNTKNFKLADLVNFIEGQITISTQQATLKANGGLVVENINSTDQLAVNLSHTNITGQLANSDLVHSSITINGTDVSLGGTITIGEVTEVTAGTYLNGGGTEGTVTVNHDTTSRADTTSTAAPAYGATFTAIDSITTNATGHITAANLKTITIPASDDTNTTYTVEAIDDGSDAKIRLVGANPSSTDDVKLKAGSNITINVNESTDEIEIVGTAFGNTFTVANETQHLALNTSSGDLVIRTDQSKTYIDNGTNASPNVMSNYTELQFSGIQQIDLVAGDGIDLEDHANNAITTLTQNNNDLKVINTLATASERGGIKIGYTQSGKNYPVELDSEKAFVNVPWANTNQLTEWVLTDDDDDNTTINHGKHVKFVMATGALGTDTTGAGTDADPYLVTFTSPNDNTTYTAGNGLDLTGTEFSHTDTSSQDSVNNSGRTYIQDITLDTYGHVTGLVSATETVTDTNQLTTWDLLDDDDDSFTISHDKHVKFTSGTGAYGTNITGTGTSSDPYVVAITSPNDTVPNTFRTIKVDTNDDGTANETIGATEELKLLGGTNVTLAESAGAVTITSTDTNTTNWNFKVDSGTATNIAAADTVTFTSGTNVTLAQNGNTIDISATDTDTNNYVTGASVSGTTTKTLTLTRQGLGDLTAQWTDIDTNTQRTDEEIRDVAAAQWINGTNTTVVVDDNANTIKINATNTNDVDYINAASFNTSDGVLTLSGVGNAGATVDLDGRYLTSYSETDTLATVTGRGASTTTDTTFNSHLTMGGTGHYLYAISNAANVNPTNAHGLAFSWNRSGGSRESNIIFAPGSDANSTQEADAQIRFAYKAVSGTISTVAKLWSGGNMNIAGYLTVQNGGNIITNTRIGQWNTAYGWGNHASAGYSTFSGSYNDLTNKPTIPTNNNQLTNGAGYITSFDITTQTDPKYLRSNADDTSSGSLTVVSYKFNGNASNPTNTTATIYDQSGVGLTASAHNFSIRNYNGTSMVESARFTTGSLTVIGDVIAFGTPSDISFKENIKPIENALDKVEKLQGVTFDWKESDSILDIKQDIGFIAQDVQKVLPELVRENDNGKLSLRHQGIISVLTEAIKELSDRIKVLENGSTK